MKSGMLPLLGLVLAACSLVGDPSADATSLAATLPPPRMPTAGIPGTQLPSSGPRSSAEVTSSPQGSITIPTGVADAGNFFLYAGSIVTLTWEEPPAGAARYDFVLTSFESSDTVVVGSDLNASDGVASEWHVPELVRGSLRGAAIYTDGRVVYSMWSGDLYSGIAPPEGICVLASGTIGALDVFSEASDASSAFAILVPGEFAEVRERALEGWYRIDASAAVDIVTGEAASGMGWVDSRRSIVLFGPCDNVPLAGP